MVRTPYRWCLQPPASTTVMTMNTMAMMKGHTMKLSTLPLPPLPTCRITARCREYLSSSSILLRSYQYPATLKQMSYAIRVPTSSRYYSSSTVATSSSSSSSDSSLQLQSATDFLTFVSASPSPFHAVAESRRRLEAAGFKALTEREAFKIERGGKYFFTRNQSSIVAFAVGGAYQRGNGFSIVGAHTDSPCLKVKPISNIEDGQYAKLGVECYGGGLCNTWFDRDLGIAGRVIVRKSDGSMEHRLAKILNATPKPKHPPALLKQLADTMSIQSEEIGDFELCLFDTQPSTIGGVDNEFIFSARLDNLMSSYCAITPLIKSISESDSLSTDSTIRVVALFDNEEVGSETAHGANSNLMEVSLKRLAEAEIVDGLGAAVSPTNSINPPSPSWELVDIVDNNNAGTDAQSLNTSPSPIFRSVRSNSVVAVTDTIRGLSLDSKSAFEQALAKSFLISADMAHAVHPNYSDKHEARHRPEMNKGVVVKENTNQRYATTAVTTALIREVARKREVPLQEVRNDSPCGSTIGPMLSAKLGLRTIDVGNPQLSMHSIRETCGTEDVKHAINLFQSFFEEFAAVDAKLRVD
ncbi:hypothetical protein HDU76_006816 [Blyttiomyces sp. JEL0837]|nr:hypothetical protein HDU76_006816 [Blyttiomyces sp. JEL0837]